jgi:hypothetical protein
MGSMLIVITVVALALAVVMCGIVVKLSLDERRRSAARVALLSGMASNALSSAPAISDDYELRPIARPVSAGDIFATPAERSVWPQRVGVAAAIVLSVFVVGTAVRVARPAHPSSSARQTGASVPAQGAAVLLDLLSLRHAQQPETLTITGLVQNPREGAPLSNIVATALLFGADGTFLASGRAPLDFTVLGPGAETGFVITVPVTAPVARYRIGFRGEDGRIIGHVDRRGTETIARGPS